jgi:hypothetical protein
VAARAALSSYDPHVSSRGRSWALLGVIAVAAAAVAKKAGKRARRARGVYMEEVSSGAKPIEAVGTAVAAFVGLAPAPPER